MGGGPCGGAQVHVAPDGEAFYVKHGVTTSGTSTTVSEQLVAVGTGGTVAWTWTPSGHVHDVAFPKDLVAVTVATLPLQSSGSTTAQTSQVVGLNLSTGVPVWTLPFTGMVNDLQVTPTGLLAVVFKTTVGTSSTTISRSLVSINLSGTVAWTLPLD